MKKRIIIIVICMFGFMYMNSVSSKPISCTQEEIDSARGTLSSVDVTSVPIPSLGRTGASGHANIYKMTLTNNQNGNVSNAFCLDSGKAASSGLVYKIHHKIDNPAWYKAYQYAMANKNDEMRYIVAQSVLWLLRGEQANGSGGLSQLKTVARDIFINYKCEEILRVNGDMTQREASTFCNSARQGSENSTQKIEEKLLNKFVQKEGSSNVDKFKSWLYLSVDKAVTNYEEYNGLYSGTLYYWIEEHASDTTDSIYQGMLAPLDCSDKPDPDKYTCVDSSGTVHDYTNEYNECVLSGTNGEVCEKDLTSKYCPNSAYKYGVVVQVGNSAVCTNSLVNTGTYYETVDMTVSGNAILGKGEPEKVIGSYCNLFCLETSAQQVFPGNVKPAVSSGTYIIWPTSDATLSSIYKNRYPLKFSGEKTCYVVMSGSNNPVNTTDINGVYQSLVNAVNNGYGNFARRYYESSRVSGGCEFIYRNESGGACAASYNDMTTAKNNLDSFANSDSYKNALKEQQEVNNSNKNLCEHDTASHIAGKIPCTGNYCTEIEYFCSNPNSESCSIIKQQCNQQNASGCNVGTPKSLSETSQAALNEYNRLNEIYNDKKSKYDSCQSEKNACNAYTESVNKIVRFANEIKYCATYTPNCTGDSCDIYDFLTNVNLSWGDSEYGTTIYDSQLEKTKNYSYYIAGDSGISTDVDSSQGIRDIRSNTTKLITEVSNIVENRKIVANVGVTYSLPTTNLLYNYVVKRNDRYVSQTEKPSSDSNYTTIGFSNLPISFNAKAGVSYDLTLSDVRFGDNGGQYNPSNYVCNYEVTKTPSTNCVCPVGTVHEGKDLSSFIIDKGLTCYEAQQNYCDVERTTCPDDASIDLTSCMNDYDYFTCYDKYCKDSDEDKFCPNKSGINLSTCLNNYSYSYCYSLLCEDPNISEDGYKCKNTLGVDGEMDITSCVYTKMAQGLSLNDAINECDSLICPLSGLRIIYRTISLENPFPGKNISNKVLGFNDDVKGRYPGTNWNDVTLVRKHILTSRGYDGSAIYQEEPLYTFVLNTGTINAIRRYNETRELSGGYADYTLDCKLSHSRACVSDFVHNPDLSGLIGGVCSSATSRSNFYLCSGD